MKITLIAVILFWFSNCLFAQDRNELAKAYYVKAEEAYNSGDFENTIKYNEKAQQQLGQPNSKILYLTIKAEYGILEKSFTPEIAKKEQMAFDKFFEITNKSNYPEDKYAEIIKLKIDFEDLQEVKIKENEIQQKLEAEKQRNLEIEMVPVSGRNFSIGKYDITQEQWETVIGSNPSVHTGCNNCPVENVTFYDCQIYINKLNSITGKHYRLPSEAEWKYAAEGSSWSHNYKYAGSDDIDAVGWYVSNSGLVTHPVGQKQANELGIYDMSGNVWQWCNDWYDKSQQTCVIRGGNVGRVAEDCRISYRFYFAPSSRASGLGFRVVSDR